MKIIKTKCRMKWCYNPTRTEDGDCDKYCFYNTIHVQTNADRIRSMTDEELAEIISSLGNCDTCYLYLNRGCNINTSCKDAVLEWLKKEVVE